MMHPTTQPHQPKSNQTTPALFFILLGLIVLLLAAFLILHPRPTH